MIQIHNPARVLPLTSLQKFALGSAWSMVGRLMLLIAVASMAFSMLVGEYSALSSITRRVIVGTLRVNSQTWN